MNDCSGCQHFGFDMLKDDIYCIQTGEHCPKEFTCDKWLDRYIDTRCDNWREANCNPQKHRRYITLDRFNKYMFRKHNVWLWTSKAEAHDVMGNHIGW